MKNKANIILVCFCVLFFVFPMFFEFIYMFEEMGIEINLNPNDYARITDVDYKAVVVDEPDSDGKILVTERVTFDVHAASRDNGFWELWLDLCEDDVDGVRVYYNVNSVKQILPNGDEIVWEESPVLYWEDYDYVSSNKELGPGKWYHSPGPYDEYSRDYECIFFYVDNLYREEITFEIEYEMYNATLRYDDCSDLFISMYSGDTTKHLENFSAEILIPNKDMPEEDNYRVTTYGTNKNGFEVKESKTKNKGYHTFSINLTEDELKFKPYNEFIEFDLVSFGEDKHKFADYASINDYYFDVALEEIIDEQETLQNNYTMNKVLKVFVFFGCGFLSLIVIIVGLVKVNYWKKKFPFYNTATPNHTFRDIPSDLDPAFAAALVFSKDKDKKDKDKSSIYSAILLSLARKNYVELEEIAYNDDVAIKIVPDEINNYQNNEFTQSGAMYNNLNNNETMSTYHTSEYSQPSMAYNNAPTPTYSNSEYPQQNAMYNNENDYTQTFAYQNSEYAQNSTMYNNENDYSQTSTYQSNEYPQQSMTYDNAYNYAPIHTNQTSEYSQSNMMYNNENNYTQTSTYQNSEYAQDSMMYNNNVNNYVPEPITVREPLTISEQHYLNLIKRHAINNAITMKQLQIRIANDYAYTNSFETNIEKAIIDNGIGLGYFQKANYLEPKQKILSLAKTIKFFGIVALLFNIISYHIPLDLAFGGYIIFGVVCLLVNSYLKKQAHKYVLLTPFGEQEYNKWYGLYNFLKSDTLINEKTIIELPLWERYLVYATAFGISERIIEAIKIHCPEVMAQTNSIVYNDYCRSGRYRSHSRSFHSSIRHGSISHSSFSGGGGSFGYGGGGRGGGGGGGGH